MKRRLPRRGGLAAYEYWVLRALQENGGSADIETVYNYVLDNMRNQFAARELERTKTGSPELVWKNETRFARRNMININDARLKKSKTRGRWEISEVGRRWLLANAEPPLHGREGEHYFSIDDLDPDSIG